jgi:hypothetical protein
MPQQKSEKCSINGGLAEKFLTVLLARFFHGKNRDKEGIFTIYTLLLNSSAKV